MNTTARIKKTGKNFEIMVDMEKALAFKKGEGSENFLEISKIFSDVGKGEVSSNSDLKEAFGTENIDEVAGKIVKDGEVLVTQEQRSAEQGQRFNQVVNFLTTNSINPQTGNPHTPERIKNAIEEAHVNIKNSPIENQIKEIIGQLSKVIPIKLETKKVKIIIPAIYTGKAYGLINQYKEKETWLDNGNLEIIVDVPSGTIIDFYDKLNSITHGSAITEDIREEDE